MDNDPGEFIPDPVSPQCACWAVPADVINTRGKTYLAVDEIGDVD